MPRVWPPVTSVSSIALAPDVNIAQDKVGLAKETTLQSIDSKVATETTLSGIKTQTDKLTFDASNNLNVNINADSVGLAKQTQLDARWSHRYNELVGADETVAQEITLDTENRVHLYVYAEATAATNVYLDASNDGVNWYTIKTWSTVTEVNEAVSPFPWRYAKLRSDAAGVAGDTITLVLVAK